MSLHLFGEQSSDSVKSVSTKDKNGNEFAHITEAELISASVPCLVRRTQGVVFLERLLHNSWLVVIIGVLILGRRDYETWNENNYAR